MPIRDELVSISIVNQGISNVTRLQEECRLQKTIALAWVEGTWEVNIYRYMFLFLSVLSNLIHYLGM
jgi:hypothetical protein